MGTVSVVCGNPPVDVVDMPNARTIVELLKSGDEALAKVAPVLLEAMMDEREGLAVCAGHKAFLIEEIATLIKSASQMDVNQLNEWLDAFRGPKGTQRENG